MEGYGMFCIRLDSRVARGFYQDHPFSSCMVEVAFFQERKDQSSK